VHIGLIGGIGVAATVAYYQRLTAAADGLELTIAHAQVSDLAVNFAADDKTAQAGIFARLIDRLRAAGCDCAAITSLGGHFCFDETRALASLPLVSGTAPLDGYFARQGVASIGILGTARVMESGFYGALSHTRALVPESDLAVIGQAYQAMAIRGAATAAEADLFLEEGRRLAARGAEAVVLGGTDLGLVFDGADPGYRVVDALDIHVDVLARLARGEMTLDDVT
jgi:aspartate racemase